MIKSHLILLYGKGGGKDWDKALDKVRDKGWGKDGDRALDKVRDKARDKGGDWRA